MKKQLFSFLLTLNFFVLNAQWSDNPSENNRITALGTDIYDFAFGTSGNGTTAITYNHPLGGNVATFFQTVDVNGYKQFSDAGMLVSNEQTLSWTQSNELMFLDDDGNTIIAVSDCRNSTGEGLSYTLYKVSPTGEMLWGGNGIDLCGGMAFDLIASMKMIQLEDGHYVCAWSVYQGDDSYIQLQKISKTGTLLWGNAVRIFESGVANDYPYLVNAGNNQIIVAYSRVTGMFTTKNLRARKIASDGSNVWVSDASIFTGYFGYTPLWVNMRTIPDEMGGIFVGWYDLRNPIKESTYVAHVKADGTLGFNGAQGGVQLGNSTLRSFFPEMYCDNENGFLYVTWRETSETQSWQQMTAQKLDITNGQLKWATNGVVISPLTQNHSISFYSIQGATEGNVAVFFTSVTYHPEYAYGWDINNVTLINNNGDYVWNDEIIQFSNPVSLKGNLLSSPLLFNTFWLTIWGDERVIAGDPGGNSKLYMQRINIDGTLGDNGSIVCLPPKNIVVDPVTHNSAVVSWEGEADHYEVALRINDDEWIYEEVEGVHTYTFENLTPLTDYQVRVRSICEGDQTSVWSEITSFTTPSAPADPCESPVNLNTTEITSVSAKLSWEEGNDQNQTWELRYRETSSSSWNEVESLGVTTCLLEDLTPNTAYLWTVRAVCSDDYTSEWADEKEFTTKPLGINDIKKNQMTVYASEKMFSVINPENKYIETIQIFDVYGRLLGDYTVKTTDNVLIPISLNYMIIIVKITRENGVENHKVLTR